MDSMICGNEQIVTRNEAGNDQRLPEACNWQGKIVHNKFFWDVKTVEDLTIVVDD